MAEPDWKISDHVCAVCMGRVLTRKLDSGRHESRCSNCGLTGDGVPTSICWCSFRIPSGRQTQRFKCARNEKPTPEFPAEIVVEEAR